MYAPAAALQQSLNRRLQRQQMEQSAQNADQNQALSLLTQGQAAQQNDQQREAMLQRVKEQSATAALRAHLEAQAREESARMQGDARVRDAEMRLKGVETAAASRSGNVRDTNDAYVLGKEILAELGRYKAEQDAASRVGAARARGTTGRNPPVEKTGEFISLQERAKTLRAMMGAAQRNQAMLEKEGKILPGMEADWQRHSNAAEQARRELQDVENQIGQLPLGRMYGNPLAAPAAAPAAAPQVKSPQLQKAEGLLRAAQATGDPDRIQFAEKLVEAARAGR